MPTVARLSTGFSPYCYLGNGNSALPPAMRDSWVNATCIASAGASLYSTGCSAATPDDGNLPVLANNSLFLDAGEYVLNCGGQQWSLAQAQAKGVDVGTVVGVTPDTAGLLGMVADFMKRNLM